MRKYTITALGTAALMSVVLACGCAPRVVSIEEAESSAQGEALAETAAWSLEADCSGCHADEAASSSDAACAASVHDQQGLSCASCHTDEEALQKVHEKQNAQLPSKLKKTKVSSEVCLACHDVATLEEATVDVTALTDKNGTTVNPHALPSNESHDAIDCSGCHKMHSDEPTGDVASRKCESCHHAEVYECGTCHEA